MANVHTLAAKNSVLRVYKAQYRNQHYGVRGCETYTCANELGILWTGKQTNHKTCLEILMIVLIF